MYCFCNVYVLFIHCIFTVYLLLCIVYVLFIHGYVLFM